MARQPRERAQRRPREPASLARVREVAAKQRRDGAEDAGRAKRREAGARIAVGRALRLPGRRGVSIERAGERGSYCSGRPATMASDGEPRGDERLVHAVSRQRIDEPGRVSDEEHSAAGRGRAELAHRQPMPAHVV